MPRNPYHDSIALITGGAGGIGRALGAELVRRGARVVLTDLDGEAADRAAAELGRQDGRPEGRVEARALDVTDAPAVRQAVDEVVARHGRLDYLFNNAGIGVTGEVRDMDLGSWNRVIDINLRGVIHGIEAAYPQMIRQGSGHIANTACVAGLVPFPMTAAYCASKHAVVALSSALRSEAAALGVRVSVICPGTVDTGLFDAIEYIRTDKQVVLDSIRRVLMPAERCAGAILRGVARNRAIIPIGFHARLAWWLYRALPIPFLGLTGRLFALVRRRLRTD